MIKTMSGLPYRKPLGIKSGGEQRIRTPGAVTPN